MHLAKTMALVALTTAFTTSAPSSDPVGIYAIVDRVVVEPATGEPETIRIWGAFAFADGKGRPQTDGYGYGGAQCGYLYYSVNPRNQRATRAEWSDLKLMAGKGQAIGFAGRYENLGRVRAVTDKASGPDIYPLGFGIVKMADRRQVSNVEQGLKEVHAKCK